MARKRKDRGGSGKRGRPQRPKDVLPDLPDRRAIEGQMRSLLGGLGAPRGPGAAEAQELLDEAFRERDPRRRVSLARRALAAWPDCADAYVLLAEHCPRRREALALYQQGLAAGERALGPNGMAEHVGHFWGVLETRPYMRARLGLAFALWTAGRRDESIAHLQEMLRLNPNDNQGVRYPLAAQLLFLDRDDDVARLLEQFPGEGSAFWAYTRALLAFRQGGSTPKALGLLDVAQKVNRHVPDYLTGRKFPPRDEQDSYSPGQESEAHAYVAQFMPGWQSTPGAIAWLRANDAEAVRRKEKGPHPRGPLGMVKKWLVAKLPQEPESWQAGARALPSSLRISGGLVRLWVVLVTCPSEGLVLAHLVLEEEPTSAHLWDVLAQAMQFPISGAPHRPMAVMVRADERWEQLRPHVEEVGARVVVVDELEHFDEAFESASDRLIGKPMPGLLAMPGVTVEQVGRFYEAAAHYFREAPWKVVGYEIPIEVRCDRFTGGPWYAVVMGQLGLTRGLAVYEDLKMLRSLFQRGDSDDENARRSVATSVIYGPDVDLPLADVEAGQRHGWEVARADAYPWIMHKERGKAFRRPLGWELELMTGCLRSVPGVLRQRAQDDLRPEEVVVPLASGEWTFSLSWVEELDR